MATVKEVKLMKDGAMVTPVVLADSVKNLDGTKYKDTVTTLLAGKSDTSHTHDGRYYTKTEINTNLNGKSDTSHTHVSWIDTSSEKWATHDEVVTYQIPTVALGETAYIRHTFKNTYSGGNAYSCIFRVKAPSGGTMYCACATDTFLQSEKFYSPNEIINDIRVTADTSKTICIRCTRIA
jgi:hypothetical protein